jgi:hypothetical protein
MDKFFDPPKSDTVFRAIANERCEALMAQVVLVGLIETSADAPAEVRDAWVYFAGLFQRYTEKINELEQRLLSQKVEHWEGDKFLGMSLPASDEDLALVQRLVTKEEMRKRVAHYFVMWVDVFRKKMACY